jgi:protein phosphatase 1G
MGAYLAKPDTEKETSAGQSKQNHVKFGHSSMQGWRVNMEDAYLAVPNLSSMSDLSIFGVFDGHGGAEVAHYAGQKIPEMLAKLVKSKKDEIELAIKNFDKEPDVCKKLLANIMDEVVMELDASIIDKKAQKSLREINMADDSDGEGDREDRLEELKDLCEESELSIDELRARYGAPEVKNLGQVDVSDMSSSKSGEKSENDIKPESLAEKLAEDYTNDSSDTEESGSDSEKSDAESDEPIDSESDEEIRSLKKEQRLLKMLSDQAESRSAGEEQPSKCGIDSGTTSVISLMTETGVLIVANSGDSRCLVGRYDEKSDNCISIDMSVDHKPEDAIELNRITKAGGEISADGRVDGGLNLSRAIGDHFYKRFYKGTLSEQKISAKPDIRFLQLTQSDRFIVLACDGIWNVMSSQSVAKFVHKRLEKNMSEVEICNDILDHCVAPDTKGDGTGCDNMTAIVVKLSDEFRKTLPECKKLLTGVYKHFEDQSSDVGIGFGGLHPEAPQSLEFTNRSDGSSQMVGEFLIKYDTRDYNWESTRRSWVEITEKTSAHIQSDKKTDDSDEDSPPSKKKKVQNGN